MHSKVDCPAAPSHLAVGLGSPLCLGSSAFHGQEGVNKPSKSSVCWLHSSARSLELCQPTDLQTYKVGPPR